MTTAQEAAVPQVSRAGRARSRARRRSLVEVVLACAPLVAGAACGKKSPPPPAGPGAVASGAPGSAIAIDAPGPGVAPTPAGAGDGGYTTRAIALPGIPADGVWMDYLLYDHATHTVWVPAGASGAVDVIDTATGKLTQVAGFPTKAMERRGHKRTVGPSSATHGDGVVYVGNRGDSTVCAVDEKTLHKGACGTLDSMPDGIAYVARTKEVWVTTPRDRSVRILDGKTLAQKAKLSFEGDPEGFAVDGARGRFYTNLEDKDVTLAIDLTSHATVATWKPACGDEGPHGLRLDQDRGLLFVACSAKAEALDVAHDGAVVGSIDTGDGVDDLDYDAATHRLYVGAGRAGKLTIADVDARGALAPVAVVPVAQGSRNGVVDDGGTVYLAHSAGGEIVVASPPAGAAPAAAAPALVPAAPAPAPGKPAAPASP